LAGRNARGFPGRMLTMPPGPLKFRPGRAGTCGDSTRCDPAPPRSGPGMPSRQRGQKSFLGNSYYRPGGPYRKRGGKNVPPSGPLGRVGAPQTFRDEPLGAIRCRNWLAPMLGPEISGIVPRKRTPGPHTGNGAALFQRMNHWLPLMVIREPGSALPRLANGPRDCDVARPGRMFLPIIKGNLPGVSMVPWPPCGKTSPHNQGFSLPSGVRRGNRTTLGKPTCPKVTDALVGKFICAKYSPRGLLRKSPAVCWRGILPAWGMKGVGVDLSVSTGI